MYVCIFVCMYVGRHVCTCRLICAKTITTRILDVCIEVSDTVALFGICDQDILHDSGPRAANTVFLCSVVLFVWSFLLSALCVYVCGRVP